jgi:hypothetical protein
MESISEGATLPVPFNIVPTPKSIYYIVRGIKYLILNKNNSDKESSNGDSPETLQKNVIS